MNDVVTLAIAAVVVGFIGMSAWRQIGEMISNSRAPILTVDVKVVARNSETELSSRRRGAHHDRPGPRYSTSSKTTRTITFEELETGKRHVFSVDRNAFDTTVEDDVGKLAYQGTRFHWFRRNVK